MFFFVEFPKQYLTRIGCKYCSAKMFLDFTQSEMQLPLLDLFNKDIVLDFRFSVWKFTFTFLESAFWKIGPEKHMQ